MARPSNSIANIKLPGENAQRPIVPYAIGVSKDNSYQAILPNLDKDVEIITNYLNQTIYGNKTFATDAELRFGSSAYIKYTNIEVDVDGLVIDPNGYLRIFGNVSFPNMVGIRNLYNIDELGYRSGNAVKIGTHTSSVSFNSMYSTGEAEEQVWHKSTYGALLPDTTTWTENRVLATTLQIPSSFAWTNGTTAGPTGALKNSAGTTLVSFAAIPSASANQSGIVTTGAQSFAGDKTFTEALKVQTTGSVPSNYRLVDYSTNYIGRRVGLAHSVTYIYAYPDRSGTIGLQVDIVDLTELAA